MHVWPCSIVKYKKNSTIKYVKIQWRCHAHDGQCDTDATKVILIFNATIFIFFLMIFVFIYVCVDKF